MVRCAKEMRQVPTISLLPRGSYRRTPRMITIGRIPRETQAFLRGLARHFSRRAFGHFWGLVLALTVSHGATIERLAKRLRGSTHRTNHGEFLSRGTDVAAVPPAVKGEVPRFGVQPLAILQPIEPRPGAGQDRAPLGPDSRELEEPVPRDLGEAAGAGPADGVAAMSPPEDHARPAAEPNTCRYATLFPPEERITISTKHPPSAPSAPVP